MSSLHASENESPVTADWAVFVSHGSPMMALDGGDAGRFLDQWGPSLMGAAGSAESAGSSASNRRPRAILAVSAHTLARQPFLLAASGHEAVYDFGGFDPRLRTLRYDVAGSPEVAQAAAQHLHEAGWPVQVSPNGGLDHGLWTPLRRLAPQADIPVVPLAWNPHAAPAELMQLGADLSALAHEGVCLLTSGSITHNLELFGRMRSDLDAPEIPQSRAFRDWWRDHTEAADWTALCDYRRRAPHAALMHPTDEHLLPFFVAAGWARARGRAGRRVHDSAQYGVIGMDAYAF